MEAEWLRLHVSPRKVRWVPEDLRSAKEKWLFGYSRERYNRSPEGIKTNEFFKNGISLGEVGFVENIRWIDL
jgi:hypothetical protein